jgi:hypothetical protein
MLKTFMFVLPTLCASLLGAAQGPVGSPQYGSPFMRVQLASDQPAFVELCVDSLGKTKWGANPLRPPARPERTYEVIRMGSRFEYRLSGVPRNEAPSWTFEFSERQIRLRSFYSPSAPPPPLLLNINPHVNRATLLGLMNDDGSVRLPALLHMPDRGTFRITSDSAKELAIGYDAFRHPDEKQRAEDFVKVTFPAASASAPRLDYNLEVVAIYPDKPGIASDPRLDGFRRNWLNIFQLNPRVRALANHAASDVCAFTLYEYSAVAVRTPPLAPGLTALDLIRQTLDRYLSGMKAYGLAGYVPNDPTLPYDYLDTYPSLLIAAWDYVRGSKDEGWLKGNYEGIRNWAGKLLAMDRDGNGLFEYPVSGNSGIWDKKFTMHAANWWDDIGFGHEDAYSNALAYHALLGMAEMARRAGKADDARLYAARAEKLRSVYFKTFYHPATGVLAGWKSADGSLHDYFFTFVNSVAITYGLVPRDKANQIMDRLLAKMKEVGYTHFEYGLPGNLVPIRRDDYLEARQAWGGGVKEDGSDGFQIYENGGATACYCYFTLQALYQLGRRADADMILFPMLRAFEQGGFQGSGPSGRTYDWKAWDGTPYGYEGLLVDGYMTLLAVLSR